MSEIKIDKNISIPPSRYGPRGRKYPWPTMDIGDSFFVAGTKAATISRQASAAGKTYGRRFTSRSVEENGVRGVRIWRIE